MSQGQSRQTGAARNLSKTEHRRRVAFTEDTRPLLTIPEAAARLGVGKWTLYRWIRDGRITATKLGPRSWRVHPADLDAFLDDAVA